MKLTLTCDNQAEYRLFLNKVRDFDDSDYFRLFRTNFDIESFQLYPNDLQIDIQLRRM